MVQHRAEPEELRDQTPIGVACGLHPGRDLEPVDQLRQWCSVDARDDHERAGIATVLAIEATTRSTTISLGMPDIRRATGRSVEVTSLPDAPALHLPADQAT
ncbi:hypothetical protein [Streptomyces sp. NBC_00280]|uniref:hypothetical protein n=1 Tax=Streptomyces sp. NBC_00280 TaxID=2975699 RepID=UPI0032447A0F